ncbi:HNH endonuclease family protein [Nocardioides rubriscoriae]|uniref:HNH endonuclease family protein n=1 Tax=Nocardioides rubriscoriae TaxID=642762 RepID=UPI0011DFE458|nr:HNH endonuclease family protein [Nocardioides rubriscoriae]
MSVRRTPWAPVVVSLLALVVSAPVSAPVAAVASPARASAPETYSASLVRAVADLRVRAEVRTGYDRDKFVHWTDADGDGCSTREEVLIAEADDPVTVGTSCTLSGGRWWSYYDGVSRTPSSTLDIDHMVPLAEAWDSGARSWSAGTRKAFANDLGDYRSLVAVSASVNRSKGARDVAEWLPPKSRCRYLREFVAVKHRWRLTVDRAEKTAMASLAESCPDRTITVVLAR